MSVTTNPPTYARLLAGFTDIRRTDLMNRIPYYTTLTGALAATEAIQALRSGSMRVAPLQSDLAR